LTLIAYHVFQAYDEAEQAPRIAERAFNTLACLAVLVAGTQRQLQSKLTNITSAILSLSVLVVVLRLAVQLAAQNRWHHQHAVACTAGHLNASVCDTSQPQKLSQAFPVRLPRVQSAD
jgi:hypothetical protein